MYLYNLIKELEEQIVLPEDSLEDSSVFLLDGIKISLAKKERNGKTYFKIISEGVNYNNHPSGSLGIPATGTIIDVHHYTFHSPIYIKEMFMKWCYHVNKIEDSGNFVIPIGLQEPLNKIVAEMDVLLFENNKS
jgi:hypothetical protein